MDPEKSTSGANCSMVLRDQRGHFAKLMLGIFASQTDHLILTCEALLKVTEKRVGQGKQDIHFQSLDKNKTVLLKAFMLFIGTIRI